MSLNYEVFAKVVTNLFNNYKKADDFINNLYSTTGLTTASEFILENTFTDSISKNNDILMEALFGDFVNDVSWFIFEWKPGYDIEVNGKTYVINNLDDYLVYAKEELFGENK